MGYNQNLEPIYFICKEVYENKITRNEGVKKLVGIGIKLNSAKIIVPLFLKLGAGELLKRTLKTDLFECFLAKILEDFGIEKLALALSALNQHIHYIAGKGDPKIKLKKICEIYSKYLLSQTNLVINDEQEQDEIIIFLIKTKTRESVINELKNLTKKEPEIVTIENKSYKRDNKTIAQIKFVRNSECQICGSYILKSNGDRYIEAAHIISKSNQGQELPENIILLCPNHHKEFDLGNREIINQTKSFIEFVLNGKTHKISMEII